MKFRWVAAILALSLTASAQEPKEFDVASIHPNDSGGESFSAATSPGGHLVLKNISVNRLIQMAFDLRAAQVASGPAWSDTLRYDINAQAAVPGKPTFDELTVWCQALLTTRFGLRFHWETRQQSQYALVPAKGGLKLHTNTEAPGPEVSYGKGWIETTKTSVAEFANVLARSLDGNVADESGAAGLFDIKLRWDPGQTPETGPSMFTALQEQLGLRLESRKGPVKTMVIDSLDHPTEN